MADNFRYYIVCPTCNGTGLVSWGNGPAQSGTQTCPTCRDDPEYVLGPKVFDGLRHIYEGRFEKLKMNNP